MRHQRHPESRPLAGRRLHRFALRRLAGAMVASSLLTAGLAPVLAAEPVLPSGLQVVAGQAQVSTIGNRMTVTNSSQAILNWNSFSVGNGAAVHFQQPGATSQVLNRVTGSDPSAILGSLSSNGKVWLLNPNGVLFGANARIDVAGLVASTLRLDDANWAAGRFQLAAGLNDPRDAAVVNQGEIRTTQGGTLALVGGTVGNEGLMQAPGGQVVLAAGRSVELVDTGVANLSVRITAPAGEARNLGVLEAAGGRIDITAAAVNQSGIVRADALERGPGGQVWIRASRSVELAPGSRTSADGGMGGSVSVQSDAGRTTAQGSVSARGSQGTGGTAVLLGHEVALLDGATVDVSGAGGGGKVIVGGGDRGLDPRYDNADAVYMAPSARITADATGAGDGGSIVLWSDHATRAYGSLSARGGALGGDGGQIETSGGWLDARPARIDASAALGHNGQWLLDPYNILISDQAADGLGSGPVFTAGGPNSAINASTIALALAGGNDVLVSTGGANGGNEAGNISLVNAHIDVPVFAFGLPGNLTLVADGSIQMSNSSITSRFGAVGVTFLAARSGPGGIELVNSNIQTGQRGDFGSILFGGSATGLTPAGAPFTGAGGAVSTGISLSGSTLDAGNAPVTLSGVSTLAQGTAVSIDASSRVTGSAIAITGDGSSSNGLLIGGALSAGGPISLRGRGADLGINLSSAAVSADGPVSVTGSSVLLSGQTRIASLAEGDAIVLAGAGGGGMAYFYNAAGGEALSTPNGRWILYAQDASGYFSYNDYPEHVHNGTERFDPGALDHDFVRHGAAYGDWAGDTGNGFVSAARQVATITGLGQDRVYDGTVAASLLGEPAIVTSIASDNASLVGSIAVAFADKNVGHNKPILVVTAPGEPTPVQIFDRSERPVYGYDVDSRITASITPAALLVSGLQAANKVYDATTAAQLRGAATVTPLAGDVVSLSGVAVGRFADKSVGTDKPVTVGGLVLAGADGANYMLAPARGLNADITPATLTVANLRVNNKVYDTTTVATLSGVPRVVPLAGDAVALLGSVDVAFADKNVGNAKPVLVSGAFGLGGADAGNYVLAPLPALSASITPASLLVSGLSVDSKIYDATTAATLSGTPTYAALGNDLVTVAGTPSARFVDKNVGTDKPVSLVGLTLNGNDAGNYALIGSLSGTITPATLTLAGLVANNKVYDATTAATLSGSATVTPLADDQVRVGGGSARFADKNVGIDKAVTVSGFVLGGADAGNYVLAAAPGLSANITPAPVQVAGVAVSPKTYDATTAATLTGTPRFAALGNDVLVVSGTPAARFIDKDVGPDKPVTLSGLMLGGADAGNYSLAAPALTGSITPATLSLGGLTANSKVYDTTTLATLSGTATVSALAGDRVAVGGTGAARFADKNVGTDKPVRLGGFVLEGADAGNYVLAPSSNLSASITPAALRVSGVSVDTKTYDATTAATLAGTPSFSALGSDHVDFTGTASVRFVDKNVGTDKPVTLSGLTLGGADGGNYSLDTPALAGSILPATLTLTGLAANSKVYDASTTATLAGSGTIAPFAGDTVALGGVASAQFADANAGVAKPVNVSGLMLTGADAGNYRLSLPQSLSADIQPATLVYRAEPTVRTLGTDLGNLPGTVTGFVGGETLATATTGAPVFNVEVGTVVRGGSYAVVGSGLEATNYRFTQDPGNLLALTLLDPSGTGGGAIAGSTLGLSTEFGKVPAFGGPGPDVLIGLADLVGAPGFDPQSPLDGNFGAVRFAGLSNAGRITLLSGRELFMERVLADARSQLSADPTLANLGECASLEDAQLGRCLITEELKNRAARQQAVLAAASLPVPDLSTASLDALPPTGAGPASADATSVAAAAPSAARPLPSTAAPAPSLPAPESIDSAPIVLALARQTQSAPAIAGIDPLQAQLNLLLANYKVQTAALPEIERKIALVIGVDHYADPAIPPLDNAVRDARSVAKAFEARLGYEAIVLEDATRAKVVGALNRLAMTMRPSDSVVVYYAGHGELIETTGLGYWLLSDSTSTDPRTWLSNTDITRMVGAIGAHQVALISDSCYSGSLSSEDRIRAAAQRPEPRDVLARKTVVVMTSGGNEPVFDSGRDGHSLFAWNLINTLDKVAQWQVGGNVFERIRFAVAHALPQRPQYSASRAGGHQPGGDYLFEQRRLAGSP